MTSQEIQKLFLDFFKERGHTVIPSSSLISDDPSVLFTTAGMQQFKPYYLGEKSPYGNKVVSIQKCFRTSDIDSVGDESHLTFFEMLGNFSFGDYFKKEAIKYAYEFITQILGVEPRRISVSIFEGDPSVPRDEESYKIWTQEIGMSKEKIKAGNREDNFWGPTGLEGPCGPTTEIYIDGLEIWNLVFNEYYQENSGVLRKLKNPGVDTGMGLERLTAVMQGTKNVFETDIFQPLITKIRELAPALDNRLERIFCDHLRAIAFLISDGLRPSNKEAGYILRRLWRRLLAYQIKYGLSPVFTFEIIKLIPVANPQKVIAVLEEESTQFQKVIARGLKELENYSEIDGQKAFYLYESFGLPLELIKELAPGKVTENLEADFQKIFEKHQEASRAGLNKKFGGHGLKEDGKIIGVSEDEKQKIIRLHTATHLLQQALIDLFGEKIKQMGSDINPERLRFDFLSERKLTPEEIRRLEEIVSQKIKENLPITCEEKTKEQAIKDGAKAFFKAKYPDRVKVYSIGNYSREICNGPHVKNTAEIGQFKILKEEAVGAGIRRIRATVE